MEHLIIKYLQNQLSSLEAAELKTWIEKSALNRKVFENIVGEWSLSKDQINHSKETIRNRILHDLDRQESTKSSINQFSLVFRIAAMLIVGAGIMFLLVSKGYMIEDSPVEAIKEVVIEKETDLGQRITFNLPDGSRIKLNAGSKLIFPSEFSSGRREVTLIGEAFFEIERDEQKPFYINSGDVRVQVLGTSFNIRSYPEEYAVSIGVKSGKVSVSALSDESSMILSPKDLVNYKEGKFTQGIIRDEDIIFGWADQIMVFHDLEIGSILTKLEKWYGVQFIVEKTLDPEKKFTAKYKSPTLESVLESLSYAFDFKYEMDEKKILIK